MEEEAYQAVKKLGEEGGWDELLASGGGAKAGAGVRGKGKGKPAAKNETEDRVGDEAQPAPNTPVKEEADVGMEAGEVAKGAQDRVALKRKAGGKAAVTTVTPEVGGQRRSKRNKVDP